ncbi:MAG: hypothetical protein JXQ26_08020 [Tissierellales bacterium]|nr:hypothetical protein [Tissierellales bacterium]MBN2827921.1 hypothetical protein [Tissierellales bacterium]
MSKKWLALMFIPIFLILYYSSNSGNTAIGLVGILWFIFIAIAQFIVKR